MANEIRQFRVQRIRSCTQCHELLPLKCKKCELHPNRKPKIQELFDWPPILKIAPCGCFLIACQAPGCKRTVWRYSKLKNKEGKSIAKNFCCSKQCALAVANSCRDLTKILVPCGYCGTVKNVVPSVLKARMNIYCHKECYYLYRRKKAFEENEAKRLAVIEETKTALIECLGGCKGINGDRITLHTQTGRSCDYNTKYTCNVCKHERREIVGYAVAR